MDPWPEALASQCLRRVRGLRLESALVAGPACYDRHGLNNLRATASDCWEGLSWELRFWQIGPY